jgi:hypothetical protein
LGVAPHPKSEPPRLPIVSLLVEDSEGKFMPTRYLKPGVRDSEAIDNLSPQAEILFYRLLVTVDDFGRFDARPAMIKAQCFPIKDSISISKCKDLLDELNNKGLIYIYEAGGKLNLMMCKWDNVPRAKESKYPAPTDVCLHLHTSVNQVNTDAPLTVTETKTETKTKTVEAPEGVSPEVWQDWLQLRKAKKAPVTQTVVNSATKEAEKAGMSLNAFLTIWCARGSQGLQAEWLKSNERQQFANKFDVAHITTPPPPNQDAALRKIEEDGKRAVKPSLEVLARMAELRKKVQA